MTLWIIRDRRNDEEQICRDLVNGEIHSVYFTPDAAEANRYQTEKVWRISVNAVDVTGGGLANAK